VILPDNDDVGRKHGEDVARALAGVAASVKVVCLPGLSRRATSRTGLRPAGPLAELQLLANAAPALG